MKHYLGRGNTDQEKYLWYLVEKGIVDRYGDNVPQEVYDRIENVEMPVITENDFTDYILIIWDILDFCRTPERVFKFCEELELTAPDDGIIPIGPGRGSVGGSMVCYTIGIHDVDPLLYDLFFERFLNPERIAYPDIDVDISQRWRHLVLKYIEWKYGYTSQIITYSTLSARSVFSDVLDSANIPPSIIRKIKDFMPQEPGLKIADMFEHEEFCKAMDNLVFPDIEFTFNATNIDRCMHNIDMLNLLTPDQICGVHQVQAGILQEYKTMIPNALDSKKALSIMQSLEKLNKHESTHSGGVVISPVDLAENIPLMCDDNNALVSQYDMRILEECGFLKMDMLGLRTVDVNHEAERLVRKWHDDDYRNSNIPLDDEQAIDLIKRGDTVGIFQIESSGFTQMMQDMDIGGYESIPYVPNEMAKHKNIDLRYFRWVIAGLSMYRPGPLDAIIEGKTMVDHIIDRKLGKEPTVYLFPEEERYLADTYGVIIYQEQVMARVRQMTGCTYGRADILRKVMGKKDKVEMKYQMEWFIETAMKHNFTSRELTEEQKRQIVERASEQIETFARYGFNKSHASEYALICYINAYLKIHYPVAFFTALLNSEIDKNKEQKAIIRDMTQHHIKILPPTINDSHRLFTMTGQDTMRFGLGAISGLGEKSMVIILGERENNGKFASIEEYRARIPGGTCNINVMKNLAKCGAFDDLIPNCIMPIDCRATLVASMKALNDKINKMGRKQKGTKPTPQQVISRFGTLTYEVTQDEEDLIKYATWEKEVLNFFISAHPLDAYKDEMERWTVIDGVDNEDLPKEFYIAGFYAGKHEITIQKEGRNKGKTMAFVNIETMESSYEATLFPDIYKSCLPYLKDNSVIVLKGKRNMYKGNVTIQGMYVRQLQNEGIRDCPECHIRFDDIPVDVLFGLQQVFAQHPGTTKVIIHTYTDSYDIAVELDNTIALNDYIIQYIADAGGQLSYKPI